MSRSGPIGNSFLSSWGEVEGGRGRGIAGEKLGLGVIDRAGCEETAWLAEAGWGAGAGVWSGGRESAEVMVAYSVMNIFLSRARKLKEKI